MNQNSRPIKGREAFPVVPPLLVANATHFLRQLNGDRFPG